MIAFKMKLSTKEIQNLTMMLERARKKGDLEEVNRVTSVLSLGSGYDIDTVADILRMGVSTLYQTLKRYLMNGADGLCSKRRPGRPPKLTKTQRKKLSTLIDAGPEKCGFSGGCWRSPMIQELILEKFKVSNRLSKHQGIAKVTKCLGSLIILQEDFFQQAMWVN